MADNNSTFTILYFANASSFAGRESEELPAPLAVTELFVTLEKKYPGIGDVVLSSSMVAVNTEYVDLTDKTVVIKAGDEVGIIPPVSSG
ncbi:hypothetical protein BROUX41_001425 [Berkeleyomyces rouxiae]|uniref:uncharacterized protein n=1 Tax=Berkeleyomyces rouxiae TaxID=2035830 RepID=UPI003B765514